MYVSYTFEGGKETDISISDDVDANSPPHGRR